MKPEYFDNQNEILNLIFTAELFNKSPGLIATEDEYKAAKLDDDGDDEGTLDERVFRMWINSLNIPECFINHLIEDLRDGVKLIRL